MAYQNLLILASFILLYSVFAKRIEGSVISGPFLALAFGVLLGPRGLASIVFAIMVLDIGLPHKSTIILTMACTIFLSVVLHGLQQNPLSKV